MKHRVPRKGVLLALAVLLVLAIHVAVLHAVVSVRGWWWPAIAGIALVLAVKAVIVAHVRKSRRVKATSPEILAQRQSGISGWTNLADCSRDSRGGRTMPE
jgi:membrane protein YdbS with pleckstrin-like domain